MSVLNSQYPRVPIGHGVSDALLRQVFSDSAHVDRCLVASAQKAVAVLTSLNTIVECSVNGAISERDASEFYLVDGNRNILIQGTSSQIPDNRLQVGDHCGISYISFEQNSGQKKGVFLDLVAHSGLMPTSPMMRRWLAQSLGIRSLQLQNVSIGEKINLTLLDIMTETHSAVNREYAILARLLSGTLKKYTNFLVDSELSRRLNHQLCDMHQKFFKSNFSDFVASYRAAVDLAYAYTLTIQDRPCDPNLARKLIADPFVKKFNIDLSFSFFLARSGMDANSTILAALKNQFGADIKSVYPNSLYYERMYLLRRTSGLAVSKFDVDTIEQILDPINVVWIDAHDLTPGAIERRPIDVVETIQAIDSRKKMEWPTVIVIDTVFDLKGADWHLSLLGNLLPHLTEGEVLVVFFDSGHKFWGPFGQEKIDFGTIQVFGKTDRFAPFMTSLGALTGIDASSTAAVYDMMDVIDVNNDYQLKASSNADLADNLISPDFKKLGRYSDIFCFVNRQDRNLIGLEFDFKEVSGFSIEWFYSELIKRGCDVDLRDSFSFPKTSLSMLGPTRIRVALGIEPEPMVIQLADSINQIFYSLTGGPYGHPV